MRDLAEVRRFWPKAAEIDFCGPLYVARPVRRHELTIAESLGGGWFLSDWRDGGPELSAVYRGPTIAAAMAAAGFARRPKSKFRNQDKRAKYCGQILFPSSRVKPFKTFTPMESRQRPRKGVRLGKGRRAQAAKGGRG
jgi:hypothetical protein